jgi:hypothetical protein
MKTLIGFILICLFGLFSLNGQQVTVSWLKTGKAGWDEYYSFPKIATLPNLGDFYLYGYFDDYFKYGNTTITPISCSYPTVKRDGFLAKLNSEGNLLFCSHFGDTAQLGYYRNTGNSNAIHEINIQTSANLITAGTYSYVSLFGRDTLHSVRNSIWQISFFISSYDNQGNYTSLKKESAGSHGFDIVRDARQNIYTTFYYFDTAYVNGQRLPIMTNNDNTLYDNASYIIKYNPNYQFKWKLQVTTTTGWPGKMQVGKQNDLYFSGFLGRMSPDSRPNPVWKIGTRTIPNTEQMVGYIAKADSNGNMKWVKTITGTGDAFVHYITLDANENIYATGYYSESATFAPGITLNSVGDRDIFLAKYDKNGNVLWAKSMGGTGRDWAVCLAIDETTNSLYMSGDFYNTATFAPGKTVTSAGENDVFFAWFDLNGTLQKVIRMGGTSYDTRGWCTVPASSQLLVSGNFSNTADFLGTTLQADAPPDFQGRKQNFFIAKLKWEGPLALESLRLTALPCRYEQARLQWQSIGSFAPCTFYVERSTDGHIWKDIHSACLNEGQQDGTFNYTDPTPPFGKVFYRIRYDSENDFRYSNIVQTQCNTKVEATEVEVYPNPVSDKIYVKSPSAVRWFSSSGQEIFLPADPDGSWRTDHLPAGIYFAQTQGQSFKWIKW